MVKNFSQQSQNFLTVPNTKPSKTYWLPVAAFVLFGIVKMHKDFIFHHNIQPKPAKHMPPKMLGGVEFPVSHTEDLKNCTYSLSSLVLNIDGWVQGNGSCVVLLLTSHQCSIHCESNRMTTVQASRDGRPTDHSSVYSFNRKPHVIDQILLHLTWTLTIFSYLTENLGCFVNRLKIYVNRLLRTTELDDQPIAFCG